MNDDMLNKIVPIILAGGKGTRLWPYSRSQYPKQFLKINSEYSLLQNTVLRITYLIKSKPIIICNSEHRFIVAEQLREINIDAQIVLEPIGRNTAPAVAIASLIAQERGQFVIALPADHFIEDKLAFYNAIETGLNTAKNDKLVIFGITPDKAETAYGYIKPEIKSDVDNFKVNKFVEKPDQELAKQYFDSGNYLWNSGIFIFKPSIYISELKKFANDIYDECHLIFENLEYDLDFIRLNEKLLFNCRDESIDFAVMEYTELAYVVPLSCGWSDVGTWNSLYNLSEKDQNNNVFSNTTYSIKSYNNMTFGSDRLIGLIGINDVIVVDTKDALLISHRDSIDGLKDLLYEMNIDQRVELNDNYEVYRPWGKYESLTTSDRFQVKKIIVHPGQKLSLQMHYHRSEHWVVVSGTAKIIKGDESFLLTENQSTYIKIGEIHSLENPGKVPLIIIEVQSGIYLGEDDILRLKDTYGRI